MDAGAVVTGLKLGADAKRFLLLSSFSLEILTQLLRLVSSGSSYRFHDYIAGVSYRHVLRILTLSAFESSSGSPAVTILPTPAVVSE